MGNRRTKQRHDAVAGVLVHRTLEAVHAFGEDREESFEDGVPFLGVELFRKFHEPFTSANNTVTCFRSPSSAERDCRILSARCLGV